jgi:hypothetical protein
MAASFAYTLAPTPFSTTSRDTNDEALEYADSECQRLAETSGLAGRFKAWLSAPLTYGPKYAARYRLSHSQGPYVLVDGSLVADDWNHLIGGALLHAIDLTETGAEYRGDVWTGTDYAGFPSNPACLDWTSSSELGVSGRSYDTDSSWSGEGYGATAHDCAYQQRLYCLQQ